MDKIEVLVFFHILGAFLICGGAGLGIGSRIMMARTVSVGAIGMLSMAARRSVFVVTLPGALLVLGTGTWLVADYPFFDVKEFWLWGSYVLWTAALGLDHAVMGPFLAGIHRHADSLEASGTLESEELRSSARAPKGAVVGFLVIALVVAALYLMVFRPGN